MSTLRVNNVTDLGDDAVITDGALVGAGKILQVVSTTKTNIFTTASSSFTPITGFSVSITPSSSDSKIFVIVNLNIGGPAASDSQSMLVLKRDSTQISIGDAASSRTRASAEPGPPTPGSQEGIPLTFLDSPATTSAITYSVDMRSTGGGVKTVNRTGSDSDATFEARTASTITVMEVAG